MLSPLLTVVGKLVRDRIPAIIRRNGEVPITRTLDDPAFRKALRAKLIEEANEAAGANTPHLADELADLLEVIWALAAAERISLEAVETARANKLAERGGFAKRIYLVATRPNTDLTSRK